MSLVADRESLPHLHKILIAKPFTNFSSSCLFFSFFSFLGLTRPAFNHAPITLATFSDATQRWNPEYGNDDTLEILGGAFGGGVTPSVERRANRVPPPAPIRAFLDTLVDGRPTAFDSPIESINFQPIRVEKWPLAHRFFQFC